VLFRVLFKVGTEFLKTVYLNAPPDVNIKMSLWIFPVNISMKPPPNSAFPRLISRFRWNAIRTCLLHFESLVFSATFLYQKDERALPGNLLKQKFPFSTVKCSVFPSAVSLSRSSCKRLSYSYYFPNFVAYCRERHSFMISEDRTQIVLSDLLCRAR
jgi:hypothetical protein